ncbi:MAG TPA: hypothetical protein VHM91_24615, partial [Verrucomicrobiales bacterium]|nr:hypothetical protein [Verrucomicrobiales bacterium]
MVPSTESAEPRRPSRRKRVFKRILITGAGLAIALAAFYLWENWKGRKALEESVAEWIEGGYSLKPESFLPPAGPAADNF